MSVCYYNCDICNNSIYEEYVHYCVNMHRMCEDCHEADLNEEGEYESEDCPFCIGTEINYKEFSNYLMENFVTESDRVVEKAYQVYKTLQSGTKD